MESAYTHKVYHSFPLGYGLLAKETAKRSKTLFVIHCQRLFARGAWIMPALKWGPHKRETQTSTQLASKFCHGNKFGNSVPVMSNVDIPQSSLLVCLKQCAKWGEKLLHIFNYMPLIQREVINYFITTHFAIYCSGHCFSAQSTV